MRGSRDKIGLEPLVRVRGEMLPNPAGPSKDLTLLPTIDHLLDKVIVGD